MIISETEDPAIKPTFVWFSSILVNSCLSKVYDSWDKNYCSVEGFCLSQPLPHNYNKSPITAFTNHTDYERCLCYIWLSHTG